MTERYPMLPPAADTLDSLSAQRPPGDRTDETPPGDPIFAAIQACRTAKRESDAADARVNSLHALARHAYIKKALGCDEDAYTEGPASALWDAYGAFAETVPTTLAGLFAMLIFADQITDHDRDALGVTIFSTFATAAKALIGGDSPPFGQEVLSWGGRGRVEGGAGLQHGAGDVEEAIGH